MPSLVDDPEMFQGQQTRPRRRAEVRLGVAVLKAVVHRTPESEWLAARGIVHVGVGRGRPFLRVQSS